MRIGLIDADIMWGEHVSGRRYRNTKADIFPNLSLMKLSAYYKSEGHDVEWYNGIGEPYDMVFVSKVFSTTPTSREYIRSGMVYYGGTGFCIELENGKEVYREPQTFDESDRLIKFHQGYFISQLRPEVEHIMPDYSLYPTIQDTAYGFLTRGCPRGCKFCHVAPKEGKRSHKVADLSEWWNGQKHIVLCDPNILACSKRSLPGLLKQLADSKAWVDINQGLDARLLTPEIVAMLNEIKLSTIHFAWDDYKQKDAVLRGLKLFADGYKRPLAKSHSAQVFVLTNYDTTPEQDLERVYTLRDMGFEPYIMVYDKQHAAPFYKSLQRWVNMRAIFHRIDRFEDYDRSLAKE